MTDHAARAAEKGVRTPMCIGFHEKLGVCREPRDPKSAWWCTACERERRASITASFHKIRAEWPR